MTKVNIPDAAVHAAINGFNGSTGSYFKEHMEDAITSAFPHLQPVDVAAVLNSAALIIEGRSTAVNDNFIQSLVDKKDYEIAGIIAESDISIGAEIRALSAEPAQGEQWSSDMDNAPTGEMLLLACANWPLVKCGREVPVKVGYKSFGTWVVFGASWTPTHWIPLPAAPIQEAEA